MYKQIIAKEWRYMRWVLLIMLVINMGIVASIGITYHYTIHFLEEIPQDLFNLLKEYPLSQGFLVLFDDYTTYVWSQWNGKNLLQLGSLMAIIMASLQFAGERSKQTMGFFLSRPISRKQAFCGKVLAGMLFLFLLFGVSTILLFLLSLFLGYTSQWGRIFPATFLSLLWLTVFYLACTLVSIKCSEPIPAGAIMGGGALFLSIFGLFSSTRSLSIFYQIRAGDYLLHQGSLLQSLLPALFLALLLFQGGLCLFYRQDY